MAAKTVLLREALYALDPLDAGMTLALSTEGYSADKDALLAFAMEPLCGGPGLLVYVSGGDPAKGGNINNINPETYRSMAVEPALAWPCLAMMIGGVGYVAAHDAAWALRFLDQLRRAAGMEAPAIDEGKFINTLPLARCRGFGLLPPLAERDSVESLSRAINELPAPKRADGGCSLKKLAEAMEIRMELELPLCERNARALRDVFLRMLDQPC